MVQLDRTRDGRKPVWKLVGSDGNGGADKVVHFGLFLGFALLYHLDRRPSVGRILPVSLAFAGGIELVQWILPYRTGDWWDFTAGAVVAALGEFASRSRR